MMLNLAEIKRALQKAGFEVFQIRGDVVHVAERPRENLIMDSAIRIVATRAAVGFIVRAPRSEFPDESDDELFARARASAGKAIDRGYREIAAYITRVPAPGHPETTLDTWCEVSFEKAAQDIDSAVDEVRFACTLERALQRST
jgi:hypothetical protein